MPKAIELQGVTFGYDLRLPVVEDVDLSIATGEFIAIFGPNGGGKTTLLKLLMGFIQPQKGSISILGKTPEEARSEIGYVPQFASFDKQFPISALEVVMMGALSLPRKMATERALKALKQVNLESLAHQPFGTLSGGQAQRVLIARALTTAPRLLLLDEPTASIDMETEREIYTLLLELRKKMTILMVTHDLHSVLERADRFISVQRSVHIFSSEEVCHHFVHGLYHPPRSL
ncbi:MAG: ABC transporter ATP-binding protein [Verrucomicrobia bacterium]|nr:ABC transporter ATP-binding protein [Verrucomicrobiota bacterium]